MCKSHTIGASDFDVHDGHCNRFRGAENATAAIRHRFSFNIAVRIGFVKNGTINEHAKREELRALRKELGLTIQEMAHSLGLSPGTLEAWEQGSRSITKDLESIRKSVEKLKSSPGLLRNAVFGSMPLNFVRRRIGWTVQDAAAAIGCSEHTWQSYEKGRRRMPDEKKDLFQELAAKRYKEIGQMFQSPFQGQNAVAGENRAAPLLN